MQLAELPSGIPDIEGYKSLLCSDAFREIEAFSDAFLARNQRHLADYSRKWVPDPLHQWSRQWEYPYVCGRLAAEIARRGSQRLAVLDAGSGATFVPYFIRSHFEQADVHCCDRDGSLAETHALIGRQEHQSVDFSTSSLSMTGFQNSHFDFIYCVSVLEHTEDRREIMDEFSRILRPGGVLVVTFDISIDGRADISPTAANQLLLEVESRFTAEDQEHGDVSALSEDHHILTTTWARKLNPALLPWKNAPGPWAQLRSLFRDGRILGFPPPYTVYCLNLRKRHT